jgi:hypothetical protein
MLLFMVLVMLLVLSSNNLEGRLFCSSDGVNVTMLANRGNITLTFNIQHLYVSCKKTSVHVVVAD